MQTCWEYVVCILWSPDLTELIIQMHRGFGKHQATLNEEIPFLLM